MNTHIKEVKRLYAQKKKEINRRLREFKDIWKKGSGTEILRELIFCIFTPQSNARGCWSCVESILKKNLLIKGTEKQILKELTFVRFKYKKAKFAVEARNKFIKGNRIVLREKLKEFRDVYAMREYLVKNIKGYGYKEASHFLRNIGFTEDIAILDRHILKNLKFMGAIRKVPESVTPGAYLEIERKMKKFSKKIKIPMGGLDLILWYREAGAVFK